MANKLPQHITIFLLYKTIIFSLEKKKEKNVTVRDHLQNGANQRLLHITCKCYI